MSRNRFLTRIVSIAVCVSLLLTAVQTPAQALPESSVLPAPTHTDVDLAAASDAPPVSAYTALPALLPQSDGGLLANIQTIVAGGDHTCALTTGGGVKCWGRNRFGQLGDGANADRYTPVDVVGLGSGVQAIAAGDIHTCALAVDGAVKCWGYNFTGQLGDGTRTDRWTPVDVVDLGSGVQAIAAGDLHTCALAVDGGVKCWGRNLYGQLGDGTTTNRLSPVDVVGLGSGVQAIAAGGEHTCALTVDGGVKCWGRNLYGQLGDGTATDRRTPVDVVGLGSGVQAITAGGNHTCALITGGGVKCWGDNWAGELGDGTTTARLSPVNVVGLGSGVQAIAAGGDHTCALAVDGGVKCWGYNEYGRLGDGTTINRTTPVDVVGLGSGVQAIAAGNLHTCALAVDGGVKCWGYNEYGQLGVGTITSRYAPVDVIELGSGVQAIAAGGNHTCALIAGSVKCWGRNLFGQLGDGTRAARYAPVDVVELGNNVQAIAAGGDHTCALTVDGGVKCWGRNPFGQLGDGATADRTTPVDVVGLGSGVQAIAAGYVHTCALTTGGGVKCWGHNEHGQLGDGTTTSQLSPVDVAGLSSGVQAVTAGGNHTCALTTGGGMKCWGRNLYGQLGDGATINRLNPVDVVGLGSGVQVITAGDLHTCALAVDGGVKCWGLNESGRLGDGTTINRLSPVDVVGLGSGVQTIAAGDLHTCALAVDGGVKCWGYNGYGQLGDGANINRTTPVDVAGLGSGVRAISAGGSHTCALAADGSVKCWGRNDTGQLGINPGWTPADVVIPDSSASNALYLPVVQR